MSAATPPALLKAGITEFKDNVPEGHEVDCMSAFKRIFADEIEAYFKPQQGERGSEQTTG